MSSSKNQAWLDAIKWNTDGLVPVITQDFETGNILTHAWMNREALSLTQEQARAVYWSRSSKNYGARVKNPGTSKSSRRSFWIVIMMRW